MHVSTLLLRRVLLAFGAVAADLAAADSAVADSAFHITYGTTGSAQHRNADGATFAVETPSGELVVAGTGAGFWTDTGQRQFNPLIARIDHRGELRWQRIYAELENQSVLALAARGEDQMLLLEKWELGDSATTLTLLQIDERGEASSALATLSVDVIGPVVVTDAERGYLLIAGSRVVKDVRTSALVAQVQLIRLDFQGRVTRSELVVRGNEQLRHLGADELLFSGWDQAARNAATGFNPNGIRATIVQASPSGEAELSFTIDGALCNRLVASRDRVVCIQSPPIGNDGTRDALVAYTRAGQELWRRELEPRASVEQMRLLDSGELVYSIREEANESPIVNRVSASGDVLWSQALRSTGPYTFLTRIEPLANGRLAFLGTTGAWNGFTSTDTDAMLFVTSGSGSGLEAPEIVSRLVDTR